MSLWVMDITTTLNMIMLMMNMSKRSLLKMLKSVRRKPVAGTMKSRSGFTLTISFCVRARKLPPAQKNNCRNALARLEKIYS